MKVLEKDWTASQLEKGAYGAVWLCFYCWRFCNAMLMIYSYYS